MADMIINVDVESLPLVLKGFTRRLLATCRQHDISVYLSEKDHVKYGDYTCHGYVDDAPRVLACACAGPWQEWFPTLVHESCHVDQLIEGSPFWKVGGNCYAKIDDWVSGKLKLPKKQVASLAQHCLELELDCERRSLQKILDYELPFDPIEYVQRANAYIYFYLAVPKLGRWNAPGRAPHAVQEVWKWFPSTFSNDYATLRPAFLDLYKQHCL